MRAFDGQLTGVMDGLAICREHHLVLPEWLTEKSIEYLAYLTPDQNGRMNSRVRGRIKQERTRLGTRQRAKLLHEIYRGHQLFEIDPKLGLDFLKPDYSKEVLDAAREHGTDLYPKKMTQINAANIVELLVKDTWASAKESSILLDYKKAMGELKLILEVERLTDQQAEYLAFDLDHVRPETLLALGCPPINFREVNG